MATLTNTLKYNITTHPLVNKNKTFEKLRKDMNPRNNSNNDANLTEEQILLVVAVSVVLFIVFFTVGFCLIYRRSRLKESLIRNKPIMVRMFSKSTESRRNAVTEETFESRDSSIHINVDSTPEKPTEKIFPILEEIEEEENEETQHQNEIQKRNDVIIKVEVEDESEFDDEDYADDIISSDNDYDDDDEDDDGQDHGTLNKNFSKSLPSLHDLYNSIDRKDRNMHHVNKHVDIDNHLVEEKRGSVILDPVYLIDTKKQRVRKKTIIEMESTKYSQSLPPGEADDILTSGRHYTMQNPHIYIRSLKERGVLSWNVNNDTAAVSVPITRFHSLHNLNHLHASLPRATSVERIPIENSSSFSSPRRFTESKLTEIAPGCYSVPIQDKRKNKDPCEIKVFY